MALLIYPHVSKDKKYCLYVDGRKLCCGELADLLVIRKLIKENRSDLDDSESIHGISKL